MASIVGFSISTGIGEEGAARASAARGRALAYYPHLECQSIDIGRTQLDIWGHAEIKERLHRMPDGDLLVLAGSPHQAVSWDEVEEGLQAARGAEEYELPWDGRVVLLRISADGERWTMWNDWVGSLPVYHARVGGGRLASTLEPVVVAGGGYTPGDFFLPGLVSLLINGHYLSDWTLYKEMKVVPPDSAAQWDEQGFRWKQLWTVQPSQARWETSWDDLVDEMHELSHRAIAEVLRTQPSWVLPLSSGLDSRLIAAVGADIGAEMRAYAWGGADTTDVVYSRQIAKALGIPWKHIELPDDFLVWYTRQWADLFGSAMHFHGMYLMSFLDALVPEPAGLIVSGFLGDTLTDSSLTMYKEGEYRLYNDWYTHWIASEAEALLRVPIGEALDALNSEMQSWMYSFPGVNFQKFKLMEIWSRQHLHTNFQLKLSDYQRGVTAPYLSKDYARYHLSLPRVVHDERRLLRSVYRRYYGKLAVIPGTYGDEPYRVTGRYLLKRRIARTIHPKLHRGPLRGFKDVQLRMDVDSLRATGRKALWPIQEAWDRLAEWVDVSQIDSAYQALMHNREDIRPLRKLQSVQAIAYRLLGS